MRGSRLLPLFLLGSCLMAPAAEAFVRTMSYTGRPLFWASPSVSVQANPSNSSGLSQAQVSSIFSGAFSAWQQADSSVNASYSQSSGAGAVSGQDGVNTIYFSSRAGHSLDWGIIALTEVLYYPSSGLIAESDTEFNDRQFLFTANAGDTGKYLNGRTAIYLQDVATHEAGHTFGLDHSTVNLSSMIYLAFSGQFQPSQDDKNAMRTLYPAGGSRGALAGTVRGTKGGIFGTHVTALNLATGQVEAGTLANSDGSFRLGDLPPGKYAVMMEPFGVDPSTISSYFQNVNHRFCSGSRFRRRFYSSCGTDGAVSVVEVNSGGTTQLGTLAPSCQKMGNPGGAPTTVPSARPLPATGGAAFGTLRPGETHYYAVHGVAGQLTARAVSFALYSPVDVQVRILDSSGAPLAGANSVDNVQDPLPGGKINFDSRAEASVDPGDYVIQVTSAAQRIPASAFSAGYELLDSDGHYLLALGVNGDFGPSAYTDMSACLGVVNSPQNASFQNAPDNSGDDPKVGCGSLKSSGGNPFSGGMMEVLLTAALLQLLALGRRARLALVRNRR